MSKHALGLVSVSFRQNSPQEILEAMKKTNLTYIEWGSDIHAPYKDIQRLHELTNLQKKYGIYCCSYGTYFRLGTDDVGELTHYANAAKILGTNVLRIWCGDKREDLYSDIEKAGFLKEAKMAAQIAEKLGIILCMECHNNSYTETLEGALELMKEVDSPNFRMYWQPNQFRDFDTNLEYAESISPYVKNVHVFNWEGNNKYPLSEAVQTWKNYISFLDGSENLLLEFMPDGRIESLEKEADALCTIAGYN